MFLNKRISAGEQNGNIHLLYNELVYIKLVNIINLFYLGLSVLLIIASLIIHEGIESYIRFIFLIILSTFNITLNNFHKYKIAKVLTLFSPFISILVFPLINQYIHAGIFLWGPYGIIIFGSISFFIFSYEKERDLLKYMLIVFAFFTLFYDRLLYIRSPHNLDLSFIYGKNYPYYLLSKIGLILFSYSSLYFYKVITFKYQQKIERLNHKLSHLNNCLEKKVAERTEQLDKENKRIIELTFTNSHKVRAYIARILGLINLINNTDLAEEEKQFCYKNIQEASFELDEETKKISSKLSEKYSED